MKPIIVTRTVQAPVEEVFVTVACIDRYRDAVPGIVDVTFLTDVREGIGTRFRETRSMGRKAESTELEVTEFVENDHVRLVADSHGTVWDSVFSVRPVEAGTELTLTMDARAHRLLPRLLNPLIRGMVTKGVARDLDAVKAFCEGKAPREAPAEH